MTEAAKKTGDELIEEFIPHTRVFQEVLGWIDCRESAIPCAIIAVKGQIKTLKFLIKTQKEVGVCVALKAEQEEVLTYLKSL